MKIYYKSSAYSHVFFRYLSNTELEPPDFSIRTIRVSVSAALALGSTTFWRCQDSTLCSQTFSRHIAARVLWCSASSHLSPCQIVPKIWGAADVGRLWSWRKACVSVIFSPLPAFSPALRTLLARGKKIPPDEHCFSHLEIYLRLNKARRKAM